MKRILLSALILLCSAAAQAEIRLPKLFTDGMVLQQKSNVPVWGWAEPGATVRVKPSWSLCAAKATAGADGRWQVTLRTPKAGGPHTIAISDGGAQTVRLGDVLVGEVWICSGQSNMEMPVAGWGKIKDYKQVLAECENNNIRLLNLKRGSAGTPQDDITIWGEGWQACDSLSLKEFSACGYMFGKSVQEALGVPVGLINTSFAGSCVEAWMRPETVAKVESEKAFIEKGIRLEPEREAAKAKGKPFREDYPSRIYNAMLHPVAPFAAKGFLWYQGETNARAGYQYRETLPLFLSDVRDMWGMPQMPIYLVQIANFDKVQTEAGEESGNAEVREAQLMTAQNDPYTWMAVTIEIGEAADVHPKNKQEAGRRLALLALEHTYGKKGVEGDSPVLKDYEIDGGSIRLNFTDCRALGTNDGSDTVKGFVIAGEDRKFHFAEARIEGCSVVVSCPEVEKPVAVRYGWSINPVCNLCNEQKLPASPFRTDQWPGATVGKRMMR